jgi:hypothetical protein
MKCASVHKNASASNSHHHIEALYENICKDAQKKLMHNMRQSKSAENRKHSNEAATHASSPSHVELRITKP